MGEWVQMKLCAMRLDTRVTSDEFVRAVDEVWQSAQRRSYESLRRYMESGCPGMRLEDLIERLASGQGWPIQMTEKKPT